MSKQNKSPNFIHLVIKLQNNEDAQQQTIIQAGLADQLAVMRQWQTARLAHTYADLLEDPHYRPACLFFQSDIYAPQDFSQRDHDTQQLYSLLSRYLPDSMLTLLADAIELNRLTDVLDEQLLRVLIDDLDMTDTITPKMYTDGYRLCENYDQRVYQIDLISHLLHEVGKGARNLLVGAGLRLARKPAHRAGWIDLYDFLDRGYKALKPVRDINIVVDIIQRRETNILDKIFSDDPSPFDM